MAARCGLAYVSDATSGIRRRRVGKGFTYLRPDGKKLTDTATLARILSLVIPPAWKDVWICSRADGHLQATGRDEKGRKQYRYHPSWRAAREQAKFARLLAFGELLPELRKRVDHDLRRPHLPRERVLAAVVGLLEATLIRVGNDEYARQNRSYGLTTLTSRHVRVEGDTIRFRFVGKSGKKHSLELKDRRLARIVARCRELPGSRLFRWVDKEGQCHPVSSADVNEYLREISSQTDGPTFTAKDFRTWAGTVLAFAALRAAEECPTASASKKCVTRCVREVAERLGNTPTVCRSSYISPVVLEAFQDPERRLELARAAEKVQAAADATSRYPDEPALLEFLRSARPPSPAEPE
jgi:DNA topoisomerase-1